MHGCFVTLARNLKTTYHEKKEFKIIETQQTESL